MFENPAGNLAKAITTTRGHKTSKNAEHENTTCAIGERTVDKLEAEEIRAVNVASNKHPQRTSQESKRLALLQATNSRSTRLYSSLVEVFNIEQITFDRKAKIALSSGRTYKVEGTNRITCKIQFTASLFFDTGVGPSLTLKSIVLPPW